MLVTVDVMLDAPVDVYKVPVPVKCTSRQAIDFEVASVVVSVPRVRELLGEITFPAVKVNDPVHIFVVGLVKFKLPDVRVAVPAIKLLPAIVNKLPPDSVNSPELE